MPSIKRSGPGEVFDGANVAEIGGGGIGGGGGSGLSTGVVGGVDCAHEDDDDGPVCIKCEHEESFFFSDPIPFVRPGG